MSISVHFIHNVLLCLLVKKYIQGIRLKQPNTEQGKISKQIGSVPLWSGMMRWEWFCCSSCTLTLKGFQLALIRAAVGSLDRRGSSPEPSHTPSSRECFVSFSDALVEVSTCLRLTCQKENASLNMF